MRHYIRYLSDIHLELINPKKLDKILNNFIIDNYKNEICILAGDIGNPYEYNYDIFMNFISKNFKKTFIIAGNHEYYNKKYMIKETKEHMSNYFTKFDNITFLDNNFELYMGYCFIGTTLWSNITNPKNKINDMYNIPNFTYTDYNNLNLEAINFLESALDENENCIVITHHMPSYSLIDKKYKTSKYIPYHQWFYCDLNKLIEKNNNKIKAWIYGHTHTKSDITYLDIKFLCNPIGYENENEITNKDYNIKFKLD